jgi:hypothetical protein
MDARLEWHPTEAEVQEIIEELRPVLAAISERQHSQMAAGTRLLRNPSAGEDPSSAA